MSGFFIKHIYGDGGQRGYPRDGLVHFAKGQENAACRFSKCEGFLLYETGHDGGAKAIYARGAVASPEVQSVTDETNGRFIYAVKTQLSIRINPLNGVPLATIREVFNRPQDNMQRPGGLLTITKEQFDALCEKLNRISENNGNVR